MTETHSKPQAMQCPTCQTTVLWTDQFPYRPFCSKRCQLVDFGEWAKENYRMPATEKDDFSELED